MVRDVVHDVVAKVAAEELAFIAGLAALDDATVVRRLRRGARGEPLGFGLGEVVVVVTPVVWLAVNQAAQRIAGAAVDGAFTWVKALLRRAVRRPAGPVAVPPLTNDQLGEVRQGVLEAAAERGLDAERAVSIANAVVVRLMLAVPAGSAPETSEPETSEPTQEPGDSAGSGTAA